MRRIAPLLLALGTAFGLTLAVAPAAGANPAPPGGWGGALGARNVVFVQTDNPAGNQVVAYDRAADGTLSAAGTYQTWGLGGVLNGSVVDHLASQGSLAYNAGQGLVYAVNAGSNTVSVFAVHGDGLSLLQVVGSGGTFPVSVAVHGDLVYVLNALGGGSIQGFVSAYGHLFPLPWSYRNLGLTIPSNGNQYVSTPGQVAFSPSGSQLIVTTKAGGQSIDVFDVGRYGLTSASPVVNPEGSTVPFGITFDASGHLVIANASDSLATFDISPNGTVSLVDLVGTGASATCWVTPAGGHLYASNAGTGTVSGFDSSANGTLTLLGATGTDPGTVDSAATPDGRFLYVQTGGNGIVDEFVVNSNGTLSALGSVTVPGAAGGEGILAF